MEQHAKPLLPALSNVEEPLFVFLRESVAFILVPRIYPELAEGLAGTK